MVDYVEAIKRPFTDFKKLIIGIILNIIPIVNLLAMGYQLECAKTAIKKKYGLPEWKNWGGLFVSGLLILIIGLIYALPAIVVLVIGIGAGIASVISTGIGIISGLLTDGSLVLFGWRIVSVISNSNILELLTTAGPLVLLGLLLLLIAGYLFPLAILGYGNGKFGDAFGLGRIFKKAFSGTYFISWLIMVVYSIVIIGVIGFIPYVGTGIGGFIAGVSFLTVIGSIYPKI